jgi:hypothetical protein
VKQEQEMALRPDRGRRKCELVEPYDVADPIGIFKLKHPVCQVLRARNMRPGLVIRVSKLRDTAANQHNDCGAGTFLAQVAVGVGRFVGRMALYVRNALCSVWMRTAPDIAASGVAPRSISTTFSGVHGTCGVSAQTWILLRSVRCEVRNDRVAGDMAISGAP